MVLVNAVTSLTALFGDRDPGAMLHEVCVAQSRYSSQDFVGNPNVLTWLLGREPISFERFVCDNGQIVRDNRQAS